MSVAMLAAERVRKHFPVRRGLVFERSAGWVRAVDDVDLSIAEGETLGLVGESGCGKTTIGRLLLLLDEPTAGSIRFRGKDVAAFSPQERREFRKSVQPVFQNPFSSLNPRLAIGRIVGEPLAETRSASGAEIARRVAEVLERVGLQSGDMARYPAEFSGGQRQRIAIARALASRPRVIVLDEAVSSQDISIRAQILNLLKDLQRELRVSYLFIAHDLASVRFLSDRISVMYLGKIVEIADAETLIARPRHPYTQALLAACLPDHPDAVRPIAPLAGEVPSPLNPPSGCRFHPRCPSVMTGCDAAEPALKWQPDQSAVACFLHHEERAATT